MNRFTLIVALVLMIAMPTFAERVPTETARKVASTFLNDNGAKSFQLTDLSKEAGFSNLYIFSAEPGFVVMSADDRVMPILGYSLTGVFVAENMPSNVRSWLQGYDDEIQSAIDNQMRAKAETMRLWENLMEGNTKTACATVLVAPLIQTRWDQNTYYNNLCPEAEDGPDGHTYTGCTATAMAQIMKYHNYPSHGIGSHSYDWNGQTLSADFGATTYDWNNMLLYYGYYVDDNGIMHWISQTPSSDEITAVATLMYHCGVSINMNFSSGGSGAPLTKAADALKSYFNYSPNVEYRKKSNYEDAEWKTMVKEELDASRPLEYAGYNPDGVGGHAFVCDGYNSDDYFHFNWGWSGHYDGFFSLDNLNTGANNQSGQGNGVYTRDQEAIFGIRPVQCYASDPTNLTYTLSGNQNLTLNWTAADGAVSYNIYRNSSYIGNAATNTYTETAPFGTSVYYVRSVDANGELSLSSNYVTVTIAYQTPVVDDLTASISGDNVTLSWTAPDWCYPETETAVLDYGVGNPYYNWSCTYYAQRHLAADIAQYAGKAVYKVSTYINYPGTYSLYVYTDAGVNGSYFYVTDDYLAFSKEEVVVTVSNDWYDFELSTPLILTGTQDLWVVVKQENTGESFPVPSFDLSPHNINAFYRGFISNDRLYLTDGNASYDCAWFIRTYLTDGVYTYNLYRDGSAIANQIDDTQYVDSNLEAGTHTYYVKTNYYGGETAASNQVSVIIGNSTIAQTIGLSAGTNWFSTNVDITLEDLQAALVEAMPGATSITIKSQRNGQSSYNGTRWRGALGALDVALMYQITVPESCEIELEGMPINPAEHPVTIKSGPNWIGFPFGVSMTPTDAFAGFAVSGDVIRSRTQQANYTNRWRGALGTLEPGQGYIYNSAATSDRILTFPVSAK